MVDCVACPHPKFCCRTLSHFLPVIITSLLFQKTGFLPPISTFFRDFLFLILPTLVCGVLIPWPYKLAEPMDIFHRYWLGASVKKKKSLLSLLLLDIFLQRKAGPITSLFFLPQSFAIGSRGRNHLSTLRSIFLQAQGRVLGLGWIALCWWWVCYFPIALVSQKLGNFVYSIFVQGC